MSLVFQGGLYVLYPLDGVPSANYGVMPSRMKLMVGKSGQVRAQGQSLGVYLEVWHFEVQRLFLYGYHAFIEGWLDHTTIAE